MVKQAARNSGPYSSSNGQLMKTDRLRDSYLCLKTSGFFTIADSTARLISLDENREWSLTACRRTPW